MFDLTLLCVGKLKEKFYLDACAEYQKRLGAFCTCRVLELPEGRTRAEEADALRAKTPKGAWVCVFTPEGKKCSSPQLAETLAAVKTAGKSAACFVIGGSEGIDEAFKRAADFRLSVSDMTFPHHLFRVMALEQLYRAESIQAGTKYHK
ncbi:MAG: 23S rRNA (pseudouridine(1915)-N(3))-methyltransferase RlmH [Oscillospiraceae bacterium]|nr:23S rRNA (pseudouridine(1915)-N(3))-methyltransferase RlmH [Oscillospiraceae bacterium]